MAVLGETSLRRFKGRMYDHLRGRFAQQSRDYDEDSLRQLIDTGILRAKNYGLGTEFQLRRFLEYMMIYRPHFDEDAEIPWAHEVLSDTSLSAGDKIQRLDDHDTFSGRKSS